MGNNDEYQGRQNFETWAVNLWINNDKNTYRYWLKASDEMTSIQLAVRLKDEITQQQPLKESSMYADILQNAISKVNWREIAEALQEDAG